MQRNIRLIDFTTIKEINKNEKRTIVLECYIQTSEEMLIEALKSDFIRINSRDYEIPRLCIVKIISEGIYGVRKFTLTEVENRTEIVFSNTKDSFR